MTRRMQGNTTCDLERHKVEHDETASCDRHPRCDACQPVADTRPAVIIDGVRVGDDAEVDVHRCGGHPCCGGDPGTVTYTVVVPPPKPAFFEVGKRYRVKSYDGKWDYFTPKMVEANPGNGRWVAFGLIEQSGPCPDYWDTRRIFTGWEEV